MVRVSENGKGIGEVKKSLMSLEKLEVLIGIPESNNNRDEGSPVTNAQLAYLHSKGSPLQNIPARPFLEPSIEKNKDLLLAQQKKALTYSMSGNVSEYRNELGKIGLLMSSKAKEFITDPSNGLAPNSPRTIKKKGSSKPLIDTGSLMNSITYVIRERD